LRSGSDKGKAKAAGALRNLTGGNDANRVAVLAAGVLPLMSELLRGGSDKGKTNAAGVLCNLAYGNDTNRAAVYAAGAIFLLVELLRSGEPRRGGGTPRGRCTTSRSTTLGDAKFKDSATPTTNYER